MCNTYCFSPAIISTRTCLYVSLMGTFSVLLYFTLWKLLDILKFLLLQGDSVARGPKLFSIKNYVIEIMTWKFIYTYRERCKTGPSHNRCWNWSPFTSKHTWMLFSKFWNTFPKVSTLTAWISWRITSLSCSIVRGVFLYTLTFNRPQRKKSAGVRSGDLGGQRFFWDNSVLKNLLISRMLTFEMWHVAPSYW